MKKKLRRKKKQAALEQTCAVTQLSKLDHFKTFIEQTPSD